VTLNITVSFADPPFFFPHFFFFPVSFFFSFKLAVFYFKMLSQGVMTLNNNSVLVSSETLKSL